MYPQVEDIGADQEYTLQGGEGNEVFDIPDMHVVGGQLYLNGGGGVNSANITIGAQPTPLSAVVGSLSIASLRPNVNNYVAYSNVQKKNVTYYGSAGVSTNVTVHTLQRNAYLRLHSVGVAGGIINTNVYGCDPTADMDVRLVGAGTHSVFLGLSNTVSQIGCTVAVTAEPSDGQVGVGATLPFCGVGAISCGACVLGAMLVMYGCVDAAVRQRRSSLRDPTTTLCIGRSMEQPSRGRTTRLPMATLARCVCSEACISVHPLVRIIHVHLQYADS